MSEQKHSYTFEDLIECAKGRLFGPGNAQLPLPPMLMFDRIVKIDDKGGRYGKGEIVAELDVKPDLWFFACHFKGDPVMPGCLAARRAVAAAGLLPRLDEGARAAAARWAWARSSSPAWSCRRCASSPTMCISSA